VFRSAPSPGFRQQRVKIGLTAALLIFVGQFAAYTYITPSLLGATGI
jgi:predicted MFS family arabinose efflux permease